MKLIFIVILLYVFGTSLGYNTFTGRAREGYANIATLTFINVACPERTAMQAFHFRRPEGGIVEYEITCTSSLAIIPEVLEVLHTAWNDIGNTMYSTWYLDRHFVQCKPDYVLKSFRLEQMGSRIRYHYECYAAKVIDCTPYNLNTGASDAGGGHLHYLVNQAVTANGVNAFLNGFRLVNANPNIYYNFATCNLRDIPAEKAAFLDATKYNREHP